MYYDPYEDYIKNNLSSTWRMSIPNYVESYGELKLCLDTVGSCSMLPREKQGVVDPNLKVSQHILSSKTRQRNLVLGLRYYELASRRHLYPSFAYSCTHPRFVIVGNLVVC